MDVVESLTISRLERQITQKWAGVDVACQRHDVPLAMALMRDIDWLLDQLSILFEEKRCQRA